MLVAKRAQIICSPVFLAQINCNVRAMIKGTIRIYMGSGDSGEYYEGAASQPVRKSNAAEGTWARKWAQKISEDGKIMIVMEYNKNGFSVACVRCAALSDVPEHATYQCHFYTSANPTT